jgi:hypothetical protein
MSNRYEYQTKTFFVKFDKVFMRNEFVIEGNKIDHEITTLLNNFANEGWRTVSINYDQSVKDLMVMVLFERMITE